MKTLAQGAGIPVLRPHQMKDPEVYDAYQKLRPDLGILAFVTDIVPERLLTVPSIGTLCYHPSLLPRHRGASGINWAIIQGAIFIALVMFAPDGIGGLFLRTKRRVLDRVTMGKG
jgi:methionyl-tRNA formyltransferase